MDEVTQQNAALVEEAAAAAETLDGQAHSLAEVVSRFKTGTEVPPDRNHPSRRPSRRRAGGTQQSQRKAAACDPPPRALPGVSRISSPNEHGQTPRAHARERAMTASGNPSDPGPGLDRNSCPELFPLSQSLHRSFPKGRHGEPHGHH